MEKPQRTIKSKISYSGIGLHTGNKTTITFKPAPVNHGITFVRTDLPNSPEVPATIDNVVDLNRGTTLGLGNVKIYTVEHVLSALAGLQLDNLIIELDNNEPPVGDGSVMPFVKVLMKAGVEEQDAPRNYLEIDTPLFYSEPDKGIDLIVLPSDDLRITFMVDYRNPALGTQYTSLVSLEKEFVNEFAAARTFCFLHEVEMLKEQGLIKGGSLENAIVICDNNMKAEELLRLKKLFNLKEEVFVGKTGILNDIPLRFPNEPVRHKALDLIGDLYLLGVPLKAHVLAARSGHAANVALVKKIKQEYEKKKITTRYQGEKKSGDYLLDIDAIMKIMPHRYPFLLIDRILDLEPNKKVSALKNVSINEPYFAGHFPGHPIMPGVLIVEAMAQAGGILLLNTVPDPDNKLVYFMGIDGVRFRKPVKPGDQLRFELEMVQFRRGTCKMKGQAFVGTDLVTEAELMATIVDK
ncbi:MAG: UDP-3-O-[3-hydroxymyristoyl] N-acetylglucosamine deacetylase [candidate division Zixibacteria bacterium RBG-1]|nr:MAG: UDP-3-O-[3-hydroxymyristoyl] N-acetylglucosamine deacetylase [candidate division Zixibacteria bacterium RBG-1]OGC86603.1 MAG: UDP-3-O-[3-hydroxymyristoyl] N-acetylglucosamine deacetylase [candidate division Zixibacteria bacterium RBG_19FT_COMBO_42_43]